jgi:CDP-alcohol phosphatidyltransferase-like enzyme
VLVVIGCWLTARGPMWSAIAGTALLLFASYVDCCDGEIARLKLLSSKFGAWLDTIIDELSQVAYMAALGWHIHLRHPGDWPLAAIAVGIAVYAITIYCVYYNIIVLVGSANSQDYVADFDVVPGDAPGSVRLQPRPPQPAAAPTGRSPVVAWIATYAPYVVRRDFVSWLTMVLSLLHQTELCFALLVGGGIASAIVVGRDHLRLRRQRRAIVASGRTLVAQ